MVKVALKLCRGRARDARYGHVRALLWPEPVYSVKEINQDGRMALPGNLHLFAHSHPHIPHPRVILEPGVLRVERDGVVNLRG